MEARDAILQSVRRAIAAAPKEPTEVPRGYRERTVSGDLVELFAERVEDYRAVVTRAAATDVEEAIRAALAGAERVVVPDGLGYDVPGTVAGAVDMAAAELDHLDAVVTGASIGIAITGTIVLEHGPGQGRRALSLVPDLHVCIVREEQVVAGVPDAVARLDPERPQTWISGPSATSDIELNRVEGVHGPRNLHVILVGRPTG